MKACVNAFDISCPMCPSSPYHRDSMSPRACSEFRLRRPSCHRETPPLPRSVDRPTGLALGSFPEKKMGVLKFCRVLPTNRRNSRKLDETRRIESRCRLSHVCHFESTRVEMRVDLVSFLLDVLSKLCGAVPKNTSSTVYLTKLMIASTVSAPGCCSSNFILFLLHSS